MERYLLVEKSPIYHLQGNGLVELFNKNFEGPIVSTQQLGGYLAKRIVKIVRLHNAAPQVTMGVSPAELYGILN